MSENTPCQTDPIKNKSKMFVACSCIGHSIVESSKFVAKHLFNVNTIYNSNASENARAIALLATPGNKLH